MGEDGITFREVALGMAAAIMGLAGFIAVMFRAATGQNERTTAALLASAKAMQATADQQAEMIRRMTELERTLDGLAADYRSSRGSFTSPS